MQKNKESLLSSAESHVCLRAGVADTLKGREGSPRRVQQKEKMKGTLSSVAPLNCCVNQPQNHQVPGGMLRELVSPLSVLVFWIGFSVALSQKWPATEAS